MAVERIVSWARVRPPQAANALIPPDRQCSNVSYPRVYPGTWVSQKWLSEHRWTRVRSTVARTPTTGISGEGHGDKSFIVLEGTLEDSEGAGQTYAGVSPSILFVVLERTKNIIRPAALMERNLYIHGLKQFFSRQHELLFRKNFYCGEMSVDNQESIESELCTIS